MQQNLLFESSQRQVCIENDRTALGAFYDFHLADGVSGSQSLLDLSVDLLLTDPPYNISKHSVHERYGHRGRRKNDAEFQLPKTYFGEWDENCLLPSDWLPHILPKIRGWAVIFCAHSQINEYCDILGACDFTSIGVMVWHKTNPVPFNHIYKPINAWEAIVIGKRPGTPFNGTMVHNVFECRSPSPKERIHPTQKPLELIAQFILLFSSEGGLVLDPFAGSATTIVAALQLNRRALAFENNSHYFDAALRRLRQITRNYIEV